MPRPIAILGMHRSGTSMVARVVNLLGVSLGKDIILRPTDSNKNGHWEHAGIRGINETILQRLGCVDIVGLIDPPEEDLDYQGQWPDLERKALTILEEEFNGEAIYAFKDPRTCLTLPFWQLMIPNLEYIICARTPIDIANSLKVRDGLSIEKGINVWDMYNSRINANTWNRKHYYVHTQRMVTYPKNEIEMLAKWLELNPSGKQLQAAVDYIKPSEWHHNSNAE